MKRAVSSFEDATSTTSLASAPLEPNDSAGEPVAKAVRWTAAITALGGLLFGYDAGAVSGALLFLHTSFGAMSSFDKELVTGLLLIGAALGGIGSGRLADRIGRRPVILITAVVFVIGVMGAAFSPTFVSFVVMRFVIGLAVGSASMVVPLYISEMAPPRVRGALVSFNQLALTSGILISFLVDYSLSSSEDWRLMFGLATIPAVLLFVGMLTQAESPAWLIARGRLDEARRVLVRVRARPRRRGRDRRNLKAQRWQGGLPRAASTRYAQTGCGGCSPRRLSTDHRYQHLDLPRANAASSGGTREFRVASRERRQRSRQCRDDDSGHQAD